MLDSHMETTEPRKTEQPIDQGTGPIFHRRYSIALNASYQEALIAMADLQRDPNRFSPQVLARFEKRKGSFREMAVGDEFQIYISGPWNGPVRVTSVAPDRFKFKTLTDHLEAGSIEFRVRAAGPERSVLEIESMARSKDRLVDFFFDKLPIARCAQKTMWTKFAQEFANYVGKCAPCDDVQVLTERRDEETGQWQTI